MKRKHIPGGCYCCGCEVIDIEELPTVSIPGYTFIGWGGSPCCPCAFFVPDNPQWTEVCSGVSSTVKFETLKSWDWLARATPKPRVAIGFPPAVTTAEYCCPGAPFSFESVSSAHSFEYIYKLFLRHKPETIQVCFSHQLVTCGENEPEMKWIVRVRKSISFSAWTTVGKNETATLERTLIDEGGCFEVIPGKECNISCSDIKEAACTYDDILNQTGVGSCILDGGIVGYDRVKFFDELPVDGSEIFTSEDTPEECTWEYCETEPEYDTEVCVTVSSHMPCVQECICGITQHPDAEIVPVTYPIFGCYCNNPCPFAPGGNFIGVSWVGLFGDECELSNPGCAPCESITEDGYFDCGEYTVNVYRFPCGGEIILESEQCNRSQALFEYLALVNSYQCTRLDDSPPAIDQICVDFGYARPIYLPCHRVKACNASNCDETCCHVLECDGNNVVCSPKYEVAGHSWNEATVEAECTFNPVSICIEFGSVTVQFGEPD